MKGYYYLHSESKDLIWKPEICVQSDCSYFDSPFVQKVWPMDTESREDLWTILLEALALGCRKNCIKELAKKWNATYLDSIEMIKRIWPDPPNDLMKKGMELFIPLVFEITVGDYWDKIRDLQNQESVPQA